MAISENIKRYRKLRKLTQTELGNKINKSLRMIQKYEAPTGSENSVVPSMEILNKLAEALDVPMADLLGLETITGETDFRQLEEIVKTFGSDDPDKLGLKFDPALLELLKNVKDAGLEALKDSPIHPFNDYLHKQFGDRFDDLLKAMTAKEKQEVFIKSNEYIEVLLKLFQIEKEVKMKYSEKGKE